MNKQIRFLDDCIASCVDMILLRYGLHSVNRDYVQVVSIRFKKKKTITKLFIANEGTYSRSV